ILLIDRGAGVTKLVATGEPTPIGGVFAGFDPTIDVVGREVLVSSAASLDSVSVPAIFAIRGRTIRAVLRGDRLTDRAPLDYIALLRAGGSRPVFTGYGSDGTSNIYRARSGRAEPIAVVGQSMPGGGVLRELHQFASAGHRVLFIASV